MSKAVDWVKTHKLVVFLVLVIAYLFLKENPSVPNYSLKQKALSTDMAYRMPAVGGGSPDYAALNEAAPVPNVKDRLVVKNSSLSLLVDSVESAQKAIIKTAQNFGGYMIDSNIEDNEGVKSGYVNVRVPADKLDGTLESFRKLSVKVTSENLSGEDVTDQYVDIEARMKTLEKTKAKFEEILNRATAVADILEANREIINVQSQIDSLTGQKKYLEQTARLAKITVYLSTDELSLPISPKDRFRPTVIFKEAFRSLLSTFQSLAGAVIWIIVFTPIWLPSLLLYRYFKRRKV